MTQLLVFVSLATSVFGQSLPSSPAGEPPNVFDLPAIQLQHVKALRTSVELLSQGEYEQAETLLRQAIQRVPYDSSSYYNLACALALLQRDDEAVSALEKAVDLGFRDAKKIQQEKSLLGLHGADQFPRIIQKTSAVPKSPPERWRYQVQPAAITDGQVLVSQGNTVWDVKRGVFRGLFKLDRAATEDKPIAIERGKTGGLLRSWYATGTAAGNHGDFYDNHDGDHSNMNYESLPQLTRIEFSDEARKRKLNTGVQLSFLYSGVTIGNSSTAITGGVYWRSQPRYALTQPRGAARLYQQYVSNHLYFYPEHRDHDPPDDGNGHGDVFPANTPYVVISQGSSGSDRVFLDAVGATLAAFRPAVKEKLMKSGILMPAVQMILRSSNRTALRADDYLTPRVHPTVFAGKQISEEVMVKLAHGMTAESLPPMVQLQVVEEDESVLGTDYFDVMPREKFFDTPCAIARVVKSTRYTRRMVISAERSRDINGASLTYHWVLLRGDPTRVEINKLNEVGSKAELLVSYHQRRPILPHSNMESDRVDIGVFVHNGQYYSAPGFVCFYYLANEKRVYDQQHRIQIVDYTDPAYKDNYVDPLLDIRKDWRDEYHYSDEGSLSGWTRIRGAQRQEFDPSGLLILKKDEAGQPVSMAAVRYSAQRDQHGAVRLEQSVVGLK